MSLASLKQLRTSVALVGFLAGALTLSACQQSETESGSEEGASTEEVVPMSAEPAEPNDIIVNTEDTTVNEVADDEVVSDEVVSDEVEGDTVAQ
ncbi:hypothetical protein [Psychrobacter sp. SWN149]|uniref:hypothetical protein n=1 Tax=Psychrobacter sp. SWN149 TaxID=2792057 RepID=UPI0018CDB757|nr:hypothetical protein [Psychrobacter sp. SWN149]MBH0005211.1 hypothetical protein [Psychrobacter sp. SWN149]